MNRLKKTASAGALIGNLFKDNPSFQQEATKKQQKPRRKIYVNAYQIASKIVYSEPIINTNDFRQTMDNYRLFIHRYERQVILENIEIKKYNLKVKDYHQNKKLTVSNFVFIDKFQKKYKPRLKREYNNKVESFNERYGYLLQKKKIQHVKTGSEIYFETLLYFYGSQIRTKNSNLKKQSQPTARVLSKLVLNYRNARKHKRNGIPRLGSTTKQTFQNNVKRLREAGIFINYLDRGSGKPVLLEFNPQILTISDQNPYNSKLPQNQLVKEDKSEKFDNSKDTNSVIIKNNIKNKKKADLLLCPADSLQNYQSVTNEKILINNEKRKKVAPKKEKNISQGLKLQLLTPTELSISLEKHQPKATVTNINILEYESSYGFLNKEDYTKLLVQNILLIAYHFLYKNHKKCSLIFAGVYTKTNNLLMERFKNNGDFIRKDLMFKTYKTYKKSLEVADYKFSEVDYKDVLLPFAYFDPTRTNNLERGFQNILNKTRKIEAKDSKKVNQTELLRKKAIERKRNLKYNKMFSNATKRYYKKEISRDEFYNYVQTSLPKRYLERYIIAVNN